MLQDLLSDFAAWWSTVPPEFAFLLAMPFGLVAVTLAVDTWRGHRPKAGHG